jgi:hypothetical protein
MLCCCEKQLFAGLFADHSAAAVSSCCSNSRCHAEDENDDFGVDTDDDSATNDVENKSNSRKPSSCCQGGCCAKSAATIAPFVPVIDVIGVPLAASLVFDGDAIASTVTDRSSIRDSDADPPPRLALIISARLRI